MDKNNKIRKHYMNYLVNLNIQNFFIFIVYGAEKWIFTKSEKW